jgi:hypothetical protein
MNTSSSKALELRHGLLFALVFILTLAIRIWSIGSRFWLLEDQIRDWSIALGPLHSLPLVGPPTHVQGYTVGPAFYWILWAIRVTFGPWFDNLPHGGGIGQAALESAADVLLALAVWRRSNSVWAAMATIAVLATAPFQLALAAVVWNPVVGATLAKIAIALVLLKWHRESFVRTALVAGVAWAAVHAYTGAVFVALGVFAALVVDPLVEGNWRGALRQATAVGLAVALLQVPYAAHQIAARFGDSAMGAVSGSLGRILSGSESPRFAISAAAYSSAVEHIELAPWGAPWVLWMLLACGVVVLIRRRREPGVLAVVLLPQVLAVVGYALFLSGLDDYYYLSLMPLVVLTAVFAVFPLPAFAFSPVVGPACFAVALALAPGRVRTSAGMFRMPEYRALVDGSRVLAHRSQPMRGIETEFTLPPTSDGAFLYGILGGRFDPASPWTGVIRADGSVTYRRTGP